jgi:alpha-L-rhamnosidase
MRIINFYSALAAKIKKAINDKYFNKETGIYGNGVQTELSMALQWDIARRSIKPR